MAENVGGKNLKTSIIGYYRRRGTSVTAAGDVNSIIYLINIRMTSSAGRAKEQIKK